MPSVFIAGVAANLPVTVKEGDRLDADKAWFLFRIKAKRVMSKLRYLLDKGEIDGNSIQKKADELMVQPMSTYSVFDEEAIDDPIMTEALEMAKAMIMAQMAAENLPEPKGIDNHARELVEAMPQLVERARVRVEARHQAARAILGDL